MSFVPLGNGMRGWTHAHAHRGMLQLEMGIRRELFTGQHDMLVQAQYKFSTALCKLQTLQIVFHIFFYFSCGCE